jgi:transcriptional regulator NrdR family protein
MRCMKCGWNTKIIETRLTPNNETLRRHKCDNCGFQFYSKEQYVDSEEIKIVLKDARASYPCRMKT